VAAELAKQAVVGATIVWADNIGIPRTRTGPVRVPVCRRGGVGITALFAVFDSHDAMVVGAASIER
jgi:glutamine synthetase